MKNVREFYTLDLYTCTCLYILNVAVRPFPSPSFDAVKSETHREKEYDDFLGRGYGATMTLQLPILAASYRQCRSGTEAGLRNRALRGKTPKAASLSQSVWPTFLIAPQRIAKHVRWTRKQEFGTGCENAFLGSPTFKMLNVCTYVDMLLVIFVSVFLSPAI